MSYGLEIYDSVGVLEFSSDDYTMAWVAEYFIPAQQEAQYFYIPIPGEYLMAVLVTTADGMDPQPYYASSGTPFELTMYSIQFYQATIAYDGGGAMVTVAYPGGVMPGVNSGSAGTLVVYRTGVAR